MWFGKQEADVRSATMWAGREVSIQGAMMRSLKLSAAVLAGLIVMAPAAVVAADMSVKAPKKAEPEVFYPFIKGSLDNELHGDVTFSSDDPDSEIADVYLKSTLSMEFGLAPFLSVFSDLKFEPVKDPTPGEDRYFGDHGIYAETLFAQVTVGDATLQGGKIHPTFGTAWDTAPGVYGTDFAEDYEITEMIGPQIAYAFKTVNAGTHTVTAATFFADTTFLSDSLGTSRGRTVLADAGPANTESLNSFTVTVDGTDIPALPGFAYNVGYRHLAAGTGDVADENGGVAGFSKEFMPFAGGAVATLIGEVAYIANWAATADDRLYATTGVSFVNGPWHAELSGSLRNIYLDAGGTQNDYLVQVSGGRNLPYGFDLSIGYKMVREDSVDSHTIGLLLTKSIGFDTNKPFKFSEM